ncbi:MAG: hypothetical protein II969_11575, partial [Anaerolineaceae bacterium]|nr:hypothetical protein [Anaerolineaceae bacterium]
MLNFKKLFMLLFVVFMFGTISTVSGVDSDNLRDFVTESDDVKIYVKDDSEHNEQIKNGKYVINADTTYTIEMHFHETNTKQFADTHTLTYPIPAGIDSSNKAQTPTTITITVDGHPYNIGATYQISGDQITVNFDTTDPNFHYLQSAPDVEFKVDFDAKFNGEEKNLDFSDNIKKNIIFDTDIVPQAYVYKDGIHNGDPFNRETGQMDYRIRITADFDCENVRVTDSLTGEALSLDISTIKITDAQGNPIDSSRYSKTSESTSGFDYTITHMNDGEVLFITYSANVDFAKDTNNNGAIESSQTGNSVTVKPDRGDENKHEISNTISFNTTSKENGTAGNSYKDGDKEYKNITWKIKYNELALYPAGGDIINDSIDTASQAFMSYPTDGNITINTYTKDGTAGPTYTVPYSTAVSGNSWQLSLPPTGTAYSYEIIYETIVDMDAVNASNTTQTLKNEVETKTGKDTGEIGVPPSTVYNVTKTYIDYDTNQIQWYAEVDVPEGALSKFEVTDTLPGIWIPNKWYNDKLVQSLLNVEGLYEGEWYDVTYNPSTDSQDTVKLTFYKTTGTSQPGLNEAPDNSRRIIKIYITTDVNQDWLQYGYAHGSNEQKHTNTIKVNDIDTAKAEATVYLGETGVRKFGSYDPSSKTFTFDIILIGVKSAPVIVSDIFDRSIMELTDLNAWNQMIVYYSDYYNNEPFTSGYVKVNQTASADGLLITINEDTLPKKPDGNYYGYYDIHFSTKLKDDVDLASYVLINQGVVTNTAVWNGHEDTWAYTGSHDPIDKTCVYADTTTDCSTAGVADRNIQYQINYNEDKLQLNNGKPIHLFDILSANLSLHYDSIKIVADPDNYITYNISGTDGNKTQIDFVVPDQTAVTITYKAQVIGAFDTTLSTNNTVKVGYFEESKDINFNFASSSAGTGSTAKLNIAKVDENHGDIRFSGLKFVVYPDPDDPASAGLNPMDQHSKNPSGVWAGCEPGGNCAIIPTTAQGILEIDGTEYFLVEGVKYLVHEIDIPEGYSIPEFDYYFHLTKDMDKVNYSGETYWGSKKPYTYYWTDSFQIKNNPVKGSFTLAGTKQVQDADNYPDFRNFSFSLRYKDSSNTEPVSTGTVSFRDDSSNTPHAIDFSEVSYTLEELDALALANIASKVIDDVNEITTYTINYTLSEDPLSDDVTDLRILTEPIDVTAVFTYDKDAHKMDTTVTPSSSSISFVNKEIGVEGNAVLQITKVLAPSDAVWPVEKSVTFTLTPDDDAPMPEGTGNVVTLNEAGTASFEPIYYDSDDVGKTYTYTIRETTGFGDGWAASGSITALVAVTDNGNGTLSTTVTYTPSTDNIVNTYGATGSETLKVKKSVAEGQTWPSGKSATFTLSAVTSGAPMPAAGGTTVTLSSAAEGSFGPITYSLANAGNTYEYLISETSGFGDGWAASGSITALVAVTDNGNGTLSTTVTYTPSTDNIVNTYG